MNTEVQKLIDGLKKYDPHQIAKYSHERAMNGLKPKLFTRESDLIGLVESLTKWNKVDDCLPEMNQTVIVKMDSGRLDVCYFKSKVFVDTLFGLALNVTEWKPII